MAVNRVAEVQTIISRDRLAVQLADMYQRWVLLRNSWETEKIELRNYIFATDTTKTTNAQLPWKNKTTRPKLCQIRDNLHANYMAALFPNDDWLKWEGAHEDDATKEKSHYIQTYMRTKVKDSGFRNTVSQLVYDYIDYGNAFGDIIFVNEEHTLDDGEVVPGYIGPKLVRISPLDIAFDITASEFGKGPIVTRSIHTLGDLAKSAKENPEMKYKQEIVDRLGDVRRGLSAISQSDIAKGTGFQIDGFGDMKQYYDSGMVEILEFEGDIYDIEKGVLHENMLITIVDRSFIIRMEKQPSWFGKTTKKHVGWRLRPDNLMAMGPLDNLVGMQYRVDHLENLKADVFDLIAYPVMKVKGYVEDFEYGPSERIYMEENSDVEFMRPDTTALNADMQIRELENAMEEMAGAPKQAMGIRTPGEKTAYEVQTLENAAGRIFQNKVTYFEEMFLEPILNVMLEVGKRNLEGSDIVRTMDDTYGVEEFLTVTKEDITANGKLRPIAARHFAARAQLVQNLTSFANSSIGQDPSVAVHISGKHLAKLFEELLGVEKYQLVKDNIRLVEQFETEQLKQTLSQQLQVEGQVDPNAPPVPPGQEQAGAMPEQMPPQGQPQ